MKDLNYKELQIINGDFDLIDEPYCIEQNSDIIINSDKGKIFSKLLLGVGLTKYLNGVINQLVIKNNISSELKKEGIELTQCSIDNQNNILIKTNYKSK